MHTGHAERSNDLALFTPNVIRTERNLTNSDHRARTTQKVMGPKVLIIRLSRRTESVRHSGP